MVTTIAKRRVLTLRLFAALFWLVAHAAVIGQSLPAGFNKLKTQEGYTFPTGLVFSGQQQFVWEKAGRIWVSTWNGTQYVKQPIAVLDIAEEVADWRDFGLLSVALDPNFAQNGFVYLFYVVDRHHLMTFGTPNYYPTADAYYAASISRLTRYRLINNNGIFSTDYASRKVLIGETRQTGVPLTHQSHAGGTIVFGRDGSLLLSTGDNASYASIDKGSAPETYYQQALADSILTPNENVGSFRAQMITSLCGKILRLDPATGNGLGSNPFFDPANPRAARSRVWALGFRNPFRMGIQPGTGSTNYADGNPGTLLVGDVGSGIWEDMHIIRQPGENAGWPLYEGILRSYGYPDVAPALENKDEPNPVNTCSKPFLTFADLLHDVPVSGTAVITNPCSPTIALTGLQRRYVHSPPALDWNHGADVARTPTVSGTVATATTIDPSSTVCAGNPFRGNCAIGGAFCPATTSFPAAWQNTYFFADYGANWIRAATLNDSGRVTQVRDFLPKGTGQGIVDVEYNPLDGALYYVNINTGEIMKIGFGSNRPPVAVASASSLTGTSPLSVTFTGNQSSDPDGDPITYLWDFGDGTTSTQANPTKVFSYNNGQAYTVRLTVTDSKGFADHQTLQISLNNFAPTARITNPLNNARYVLDRESSYTLTASVTDEAPASLTYAWQVILRHNNHEHREAVIHQTAPTVVVSPVGCDGETYYYLIKLTVTDNGGLTATDSVNIYPDCNSPKLAISGLAATTTLAAASARLTWTNPVISFDNVLVVGKAGSGFTDRPTDPTYPANASFMGNGAAFFGGKVLYQGLTNSLTVSELTPGQTVYFRVYTRKGTAWTGGVETSLTMPGPPPPPSVAAVEAGKCYRLVARVSGKVLGVEASSTDDGAQIRQRTDGNQLAQRWRFDALDSGFYKITAAHSDKAIDVWWGSSENGTGFQQWSFNQWAQQQQFALRRNADGYYQITARHSGKALDVQNGNQDEGGMVMQFAPNGGVNQQWSIEERACTTSPPSSTTTVPPVSALTIDPAKCYRLQSRGSGLVLNVPSGLGDDGIMLRQNSNAERIWQKWRFTPIDGGYYRVSVLHNGKSIQVPDFSAADNVALVQWTYWGGDHQQWSVARNAEGFYTLSNRNSNKVIAVQGASIAEGGTIVQQTPGSGNHQQWSITETTCPAGARRSAPEPGTSFSLYPNPARDYVLVDLSSVAGTPVSLSLHDRTGRSLRQASTESATAQPYRFDTSQLPYGLYLLQIAPDGQQPTTLRVVIQP